MPAREIGELIGEMSLFSGGKRNSDVVAMSAGYIAVFPFAQLQQLKQTSPELAEKIVMMLARAALTKRLEAEGRDISSASEEAVSGAPSPPPRQPSLKPSPKPESQALAPPEPLAEGRSVEGGSVE